jgi:hypothetical protein
VKLQVLAAASMEMAVFWDVAPCSLVEVYRRFRGVLMMEAVSTSETSVNFNKTTRYNNPEDSHRQKNIWMKKRLRNKRMDKSAQ